MADLYDLAPLPRVLLVGALLVLLPLGWLILHNRHVTAAQRRQALTLLTLFLTFDLVLFGAFTRLTDSGLGCPDWPGCYGEASPLGAHAEISAAQQAWPSGPVTHGKAWIEMIHRYLAAGVGGLILLLAVQAWLSPRAVRTTNPPRPEDSMPGPLWPTLTLVWVCVQGAFGALTVTMKLFPAIVTLHLAGGMLLLALLCAQAVRQGKMLDGLAPVTVSPGLRCLLWIALALLALQILLGGWVSTNYAVLACTDFPRCQNSWWPSMDFREGFTLWRELGQTPTGESISLSALTAIHYVHRLMAYLVLPTLGALAWWLNRSAVLRAHSRWLAALVGLQLATGLSNVVFDWPLVAAVLHTGGAAALVLVLTSALAGSRSRPAVERSSSNASSARFSA